MIDYWNGKRVFITGANGFLGSYIAKVLVEKNAKVFSLIYEDNPGSVFDEAGLWDKTCIVRGDVRDLNLMEKVLKENQIDTIFHLAGQATVNQSVETPLETFETNVQGTWNILEAARKCDKVERIVVASSAAAYGQHDSLPYQEHIHYLKGIYPYEVSKICADFISQSYHRTFKSPVCITRCVNFYGPGDFKMNRIVPSTIKCLYHNESPLITGNSESVRDYLFIEDVVLGYLTLAEKMNKEIHGQAFNFAANSPLSVLDVMKMLSREMNKNIEPKIVVRGGEYEKAKIVRQYASYEKARNVLGWAPRYSFLEGIRKTIPWYVDYFDKLERGK